ncbi:hypothetical protein BJV77DRAFT_984928, partial [Russula vinacea]
LTFHNGGTAVRKGLVDMELDRPRWHFHRRLGSVLIRRLILRLCYRHLFSDGLSGMPLLSIIANASVAVLNFSSASFDFLFAPLRQTQRVGFYLLSSSYERKVCSWARMKAWQIEIKVMAWFLYALPLFFTCLTNVRASKMGDFADIVTGQYCGRQNDRSLEADACPQLPLAAVSFLADRAAASRLWVTRAQ